MACSNRSRTRDAPTPTNISTKSEPEIEKNGTPASPATARASSVLPVPGGPHKITGQRRSRRNAVPSGALFPTRCSCPMKLSNESGRIRDASGPMSCRFTAEAWSNRSCMNGLLWRCRHLFAALCRRRTLSIAIHGSELRILNNTMVCITKLLATVATMSPRCFLIVEWFVETESVQILG